MNQAPSPRISKEMFGGISKLETKCSALLIGVTELLDAIADRVADTETTEEPVIRVSAAVIDCSAVALVIAAALASRRGSALDLVVCFGRLGR